MPASALSLPRVPDTACTADSWTPTKMDVPDARLAHTAVWTGSEMIVWRGNATTTGGRYNPTTNTWLATAPVEAI